MGAILTHMHMYLSRYFYLQEVPTYIFTRYLDRYFIHLHNCMAILIIYHSMLAFWLFYDNLLLYFDGYPIGVILMRQFGITILIYLLTYVYFRMALPYVNIDILTVISHKVRQLAVFYMVIKTRSFK